VDDRITYDIVYDFKCDIILAEGYYNDDNNDSIHDATV
jgi:hypothetical protein